MAKSPAKTRISVEPLLEQVLAYRPQADVDLLRRAFDFAVRAHQDQQRANGDPYITHPQAVARLLAQLELDDASIAAGLLHDVKEMCEVTTEDLVADFGQEIADLVEGVTKLGQLHFRSDRERQAENLRKMLLATAKDLRVILIKLADRLHNMRTLRWLPEEKQQRIAEDTLYIFAPIAHRLGIWRLKWELEDLALRYSDPEGYRTIVAQVDQSLSQREAIVRQAIGQLEERIEQAGIKAEISGRPKHFYSIYHKMKSQSVDFEQILDLLAIRVIVETIPECYAVLGEVHALWIPLPDMFTDYIAKPKSNMYQALHTKVVGPRGEPLEVQIRTKEMHRTAEYGVASHWRYKEQSTDTALDEKLAWVRQLLELQSDAKDSREWLDSLKVDLFKDQVFAFTPKGDVVDLPAGSTPVDFAYRIHTDVGHRCVGARVNGKIVPLNRVFKNGDVVEIVTSKTSQGPSLDWLSFVATTQAKNRIKSYFRKARREENLERGTDLLEAESKRMGVVWSELLDSDRLAALAERMNYVSVDDLIAAVGYGDVTAEAIIRRLREERPEPHLPESEGPREGGQGSLQIAVSAQGVRDVLFRLSRCCSPVPGDAIVGYVTRGKGMAVHRENCPNLAHFRRSDPERITPLAWTLGDEAYYPAQIQIEALDRIGLLNDITAVMSETQTNIRSAKVQTAKDHTARITLVIDISGTPHLEQILRGLDRLNNVLRVRRVPGV
jgi:GTP pyrophosphokinase